MVNVRSEKNEKEKFQKTVQKALKDAKIRFAGFDLGASIQSKVLFAVHSSFKAAAMFPEIEQCFQRLDSQCHLVVYPEQCDYKNYILVDCSSVQKADEVLQCLNRTQPSWLKQSTLPFYITKASKVPKVDPILPNGLTVNESVISMEKENEIVEFLDKCEPSDVLKNRTVFHFGRLFDYSTNTAHVTAPQPIPTLLTDLLHTLTQQQPRLRTDFDQVTANVYEPGQGIPMHVDTHSAFEEQIAIVNLCADIVMKFRDGANHATGIDVVMPRWSLVLMEDASRFKYKHGILNRRYDVSPIDNRLMPRQKRVSLTFRRIRDQPCRCPFPEFCDWDRNGQMATPKADEEAERLERKYVNEVYENIAEHFDVTRFSRWPAFAQFLDSFPFWSLILDAGCGNGKYLIDDVKLVRLGLDICDGLLQIAARKGCQVTRADNLCLPFRTDSMDGCICAAVVHHFSTEERRKRAFAEIARVIRPGGRALVSGWAIDQGRSHYERMRKNRGTREEAGELIEEPNQTNLNRLVVHDGTEFTQQDMLVPWESGRKSEQNAKQYLRYYHLFVEGELERLLKSIPGTKLIREFYEQGNWLVEFEKV